MNEPTPEEAAAALRAVHDGREQVIRSAMGSRWLWIACGLIVFLYSLVDDLVPASRHWLSWAVLGVLLVLVFGLRTRVGSSLLGRPVAVSSRGLPLTLTSRLLRVTPLLGLVAVAVIIRLLNVPHGGIYYGALAGLFVIFVPPRFQQWLLRRQEKD